MMMLSIETILVAVCFILPLLKASGMLFIFWEYGCAYHFLLGITDLRNILSLFFLLMLLVGSHDAGSFMSVSFTPVYIHHSIMGDR
jgi:hypothetical protein